MPNDEHNNENSDDPERRKNQNARAITLVVIAAAILFGILAFIAWYFVNEHSERIKFLTVNTLSLFVLMAIVIQAYIYWKQRGLMAQQSKAMQDSLVETRNLIAQNERFSRINSRAYVFINTATLDAPINSGKYPLPKITVKNSGRSPAFKHRMRIEQAFLAGDALEDARKGVMPKMRPLNKKGLAIIGAGHTTDLHFVRGDWKSPEDEAAAIKGEAVFYMWGINVYEDIFGQEHFSKFSLYARNSRITNLSFGWYGNDVEYEGSEQENPN